MNSNYVSLLGELPENAAESSNNYSYFTERHLQAVWLDQKYFKYLTTSDDVPIQVISPGIWNSEAGPDFKKAHLRIGGKDYKGDIELHLTEEDWYHHRHHLDERYDQVIFHLSLWNSKKNKTLLTKKGSILEKAYLEDFLTIPLSRIVQLIDLDLYPYKKFIGSGSCAHTLYRSLSRERIEDLFTMAADWRFKQKHLYLESKLASPSLQLGGGIAMALGYKNNTETFLDLFMYLILHRNLDEKELLSVALEICGYLDERYQKQWDSSPFFHHLLSLRQKTSSSLISGSSYRVKLTLNQVRPLNNPVRRIAYLVKLLTDPQFDQLYVTMASHWRLRWSRCNTKKEWRELRKELCSLLPSYPDNYWNHHYTFETSAREEFLPLIGEDLKEEILVNTFLPILRHELKQHSSMEEAQAFTAFYRTFPASKNSKSRYLVHRFFGETQKGSIMNQAIMEQGAFQIHRDFCIHFEASCEGCPFVDRYKSVFQAG